jgi:hypothetical protein
VGRKDKEEQAGHGLGKSRQKVEDRQGKEEICLK